jgi:hypothetical protein
MPVSLDPTAGGSAANSYVAVDTADAYFATRLYANAWTSLAGAGGLDTKAQALIMATQRLDVLPWDGTPSSLTQRLQWPRMGLCDRGGRSLPHTTVPDDIVLATCEEALSLLVKGKDPGTTDALANFSALKVGPVSLSLRDTAPRTNDGLHPAAVRLVLPYLADASDFSRG